MGWLDSPDKLDATVERVRSVRELGLDVGVDFHGRVHLPMARQLARKLEAISPLFIEEPVRATIFFHRTSLSTTPCPKLILHITHVMISSYFPLNRSRLPTWRNKLPSQSLSASGYLRVKIFGHILKLELSVFVNQMYVFIVYAVVIDLEG